MAIENLYTPDQNPVNVDTSFTNIDIIIAGNVINDEAKITGITPAIASFKGSQDRRAYLPFFFQLLSLNIALELFFQHLVQIQLLQLTIMLRL